MWLDLQKPSLLTQQLKSIALSRCTKHMDIDSQLCFHRWLFSTLSNHEGVLGGLWMALVRMCVVPNYNQWLSWHVLWIETVCVTYWTHSIAVCVLVEALTCLWLPAHPLICAICVIAVAVRKAAQTPAVLAS